jgi:hypothetical protein
METLIGFAVGYWIGTKHGRKGLEEALDAAREIWASPAGQRMVSEGTSFIQAVTPVADALRKGRRSARGTLIHTVVDEILERRSARQTAAA